jgi:hypothetical protein
VELGKTLKGTWNLKWHVGKDPTQIMTVRKNIGTGTVMKERTWNWENIEGNLEQGISLKEELGTGIVLKGMTSNREGQEWGDMEQ